MDNQVASLKIQNILRVAMNTVKRPTDIYGTCERLSVNPILISTVAGKRNFAKLFSNKNSKRLTTTQYRKEVKRTSN